MRVVLLAVPLAQEAEDGAGPGLGGLHGRGAGAAARHAGDTRHARPPRRRGRGGPGLGVLRPGQQGEEAGHVLHHAPGVPPLLTRAGLLAGDLLARRSDVCMFSTLRAT